MTPKGPAGTFCIGPGCSVTFTRKSGAGRPRLYCSDACGARYRKANPQADNTEDAVGAARAAGDLADLARRLLEASERGDAPRALALFCECDQALKETRKALVVLGRSSKMKTSEIAAVLHVSVDSVNRMATTYVNRERPAPPRVPVPRIRHPEVASPRPRRPAGGTGGMDGSAPGQGPAAILTSALSHLQRISGKTHKTLALDARVDPSYISRILSGERMPSWKVTRCMTLSCGGDPAELRPLWDAARGYRVARPSTLHAALRGLHLAAAQPTVDHLHTRTRLPAADITAALHGGRLPDWPTVKGLVTALHGQPESIRPLWDAAQAAAPGHLALTTCTIQTGAFG
ncbi:helix-turn-helix transcriptional regulator [Streptomyces sp. NPDC093085]|uniref:helix-turn-helix domain-containing protein n=1 Tax=Streptomyces sp. NPDC093085 TaxID=3155068 RepID=UPI003417DFDA